jgi:hypothetical protein
MAAPVPTLTLFIGPQTQAGLALNLAIRENRPALLRAGLAAHPTRIASPLLRGVSNPKSDIGTRRARFAEMAGDGPSFHSALNFFGMTRKGFRNFELFPGSLAALEALAEAAEGVPMRVILTPDRLPDFFLATGSDLVAEWVRATGWELLYELSWAEIVANVRAVLPSAEVLVLTHRGLALGGAALAERLFGAVSGAVVGPVFLRETLNATGRAVLDRMALTAAPETAVAEELYSSFADRVDVETCRERLGLDRLTVKLLGQRLEEDLALMRAMRRVEVV